MSLFGAAVVTAGTAAALTAVLVRVLRRFRVVDVPVHRSLHTAAVPRGGGLAVTVAIVVGMLVGGQLGYGYSGMAAFWFVLAVAMFGALGFADDVASLSVGYRLAVQILIALLIAALGCLIGDWSLFWMPIAALGLVVLVNITNFMDGADGVVPVHTVLAGLWYTILGIHAGTATTALVAACLAGAAAGFVPFNAVRARIFLGDVGSYAIGAALSLVAVVLLGNDVPMLVVAAPLVVYLLDTGYTLQLRMRAGERWYEPHKLHIYQRLVAAGWSHARVSAVVSGLTVLMCLFTVPALLELPVALSAAAGLLLGGIAFVYLRLPVWAGAPAPWRPPGGP